MRFRLSQLGPEAILFAGLVLFGATATAVVRGDETALAPSKIVAAPATYDRQNVSVTGTVTNLQSKDTERGTVTQFQLCDSSCVTVVEFGTVAFKEGDQQTVSGRFRASSQRMNLTNVVMVRPSSSPQPR